MPPARSAHIALVAALALAVHARPAHAAWGPDSVLTVGGAGQRTLEAGFYPTGGSDLYVWWRWSSNSIVDEVVRVTADGGLVFARQVNSVEAAGTAPDGLGGLITAWQAQNTASNFDIAFGCVKADGTLIPWVPGTTLWAAQTPARDTYPAVGTDPAGGAYIAWTNYSLQTLVQRVTASGAIAPGWPTQGRRLASTSSLPTGPALLPDGAGGTFVLFASDRARVQRVNPDTTLAAGWPASGVPLESPSPYVVSGGDYPSDLSLVASSGDHVFAVWSETDASAAKRIMVQWFSNAGGVEWSELELLALTTGVTSVRAQSDGQDGLLVSWFQSGAFEVAHVLTDESVVGPFEANPTGHNGGALTHGREGGFIVFRADPSGILGTWYRSDGSLDLAAPNPRLVHPHVTDHPAYPTGATSDGDGGAFLVLNEEEGPFFEIEKVRHVLSAAALDVGPAPRPRALALALSPNPARSELSLDLVLTGSGQATLEVLDVSGRSLVTRSIEAGPGSRRERLALPAGLAPGVYLVRVREGADSQMRRFALIR